MTSMLPAQDNSTLPASLAAMRHLVSPYGLVSKVSELPITEGEPRFHIYSGSLGNPGEALAVQSGWVHDMTSGNFDGAGGALDRETAAHIAVAESLERYSSCAWDPDELVWASADQLGDDAIAPARWPQCSPTELADPRNPLVSPDPRIPLRWVQGWSLTQHRPVFVPAVQSFLRFPPLSTSERYTHPVSTGCAAHCDPAAAVVNGLLEVVERDAIALTWLQQLRLPRLDVPPEALRGEFATYAERGRNDNIRTLLFDATTDLGIPVVYGLQLADHEADLAQIVVATCDLDRARGIAKLFREAASLRIALRALSAPEHRPTPDTPEDTISVVGGALLSGPPDQRHRFNFLLEGDRSVHSLTDLPRPADGESQLGWLVGRLAQHGCDVVVVDLTTDEARQVGAHVVRVLVPQLMPLSFAHRARYLAHPRLYDAPRAMGLTAHPEAQINSYPQPFA